jgi:hypothetical protein
MPAYANTVEAQPFERSLGGQDPRKRGRAVRDKFREAGGRFYGEPLRAAASQIASNSRQGSNLEAAVSD